MRFGKTAKAVTAAFALALVLLLAVFAASPSLHLRLHADRSHAERFCVVCALAAGQVGWAGSVPVVVCACVFLVYNVLLRTAPQFSLLDFYSSPSRAPPRF
jgi:hypothetical protein